MEEQVTIASAVIVPELESSSPPGRSKRRQTSESQSPETSKRPRLEDDVSAELSAKDAEDEDAQVPQEQLQEELEETVAVAAPAEDSQLKPQRRNGKEEERKRGKRLFGALLGTIGKFQKETTSVRARSSAVKRREVEAKLQEKLKQQTEELDEKRKRESDDYNLRRRVEQRDFEERSMQIRHANLLAESNMLSTNATPKLFYLPWRLLPSEEDSIKAQVENAKSTISNEETEFQRRREEEDKELPALDTTNNNEDESAVIDEKSPSAVGQSLERDVRPDTDADPITDNNNAMLDESVNVRRHSDTGDTADLIEEGGEDTVIY